MSLPKRIKATEQRTVDGSKIEVRTVEEMDYDGSWRVSFDVLHAGSLIANLFGYPTDNDIRIRIMTSKLKSYLAKVT